MILLLYSDKYSTHLILCEASVCLCMCIGSSKNTFENKSILKLNAQLYSSHLQSTINVRMSRADPFHIKFAVRWLAPLQKRP